MGEKTGRAHKGDSGDADKILFLDASAGSTGMLTL